MPYKIKIRLLELGKKQKDLIPALLERGIDANPSEISNALNGTYQKPKLNKILAACNEIVSEWEGRSEKNGQRAI